MSEAAAPGFLSEKFTPNLLPEVCAPRQALLEVYDRAAEGGFVYVGAQAGSGKTVSTLLWLHACGLKSVWLGLDGYDNAPAVFYKLLATGIYSLQPDNAAMRAVLTDPGFSASPVEHMVRLLAELLPEEGRYVLVLDDMHLITNGEIVKSMPAVLRRLPRSFVTVILSRKTIPDEWSALVRDQTVGLITPAHLRFTEEEIRQYFNSLGRFLTPEESKFAFAATDGWAIGVNAIAQSGQLQGGGGYVFAQYFQAQIWDKWPAERRAFCLRTAIVNEFDPELARRLTGREDTETLMEELSRTNTFLSRLHGDTYRYHHLFQDFLREELDRSDIDTSSLYKAAAHYYKERRDYSRALRFWLDSGDYKGLDSFLYLFLFRNNHGVIAEYADFLRTFFVRDFPQKAYKEFPPLHIAGAWYTYLTSRREEFEAHMDAVYKNLPRIALSDSKFVEYAILAYSVDHRTSILEKIRKFHTFGRFVKKFSAEGLATDIASLSHNLPYMHRSNLDYSDLALDPSSRDGLADTFSVLLGIDWNYISHGLYACFDYECNRLEQALAANSRAMDALTDESKMEGRLCVYILQHTLLDTLGRTAEAARILETLDELVEDGAAFFLPNLAAYKAKLRLEQGDKAAARAWLDNYFVIETDHAELFRVFQHFTTARAYLTLGDNERAMRYIRMLQRYGQDFNRPLDEIEAATLLACLLWATGEKTEAVAAMETAVIRLQPYGFIRVVAEQGAAILPVLKRLQAKAQAGECDEMLDRAFLNDIVLTAYAVSKTRRGIMPAAGKTEKPIKLSRQQTHMVVLLAQGCRYAEIAARTGLTIPTVKSHTSAAYRKLEVNNAMDAVLKARELGLIP